jgi:hypothetical protein
MAQTASSAHKYTEIVKEMSIVITNYLSVVMIRTTGGNNNNNNNNNNRNGVTYLDRLQYRQELELEKMLPINENVQW